MFMGVGCFHLGGNQQHWIETDGGSVQFPFTQQIWRLTRPKVLFQQAKAEIPLSLMINSSLARRDSDCDLLELAHLSFDRSYRAGGLAPSGIF